MHEVLERAAANFAFVLCMLGPQNQLPETRFINKLWQVHGALRPSCLHPANVSDASAIARTEEDASQMPPSCAQEEVRTQEEQRCERLDSSYTSVAFEQFFAGAGGACDAGV
jgi:hypothetical protein